jgi:hypothetical protein
VDVGDASSASTLREAERHLGITSIEHNGLVPEQIMRLSNLWSASMTRYQQGAVTPLVYLNRMSEIVATIANDLAQVGLHGSLDAAFRIVIGNCAYMNASPGHAITVAYRVRRRQRAAAAGRVWHTEL